MNLQPVEDVQGNFPRLEERNDGKHKCVLLQLPAKVDGVWNNQPIGAHGSTVLFLGVSGSYQCGAPQPGQDIGECDPHLWQNVANVIVYTLNIRDAFMAADPANADAYNTNAGNYIAQLEQLDAQMFTDLAAIPSANRVLVTNHDAMGYFATRYGFQIAGVVLPGGTVGRRESPFDIGVVGNPGQIFLQDRNGLLMTTQPLVHRAHSRPYNRRRLESGARAGRRVRDHRR